MERRPLDADVEKITVRGMAPLSATSTRQTIIDTQKGTSILSRSNEYSIFGMVTFGIGPGKGDRAFHVLRGILADGIEIAAAQHLSRVKPEVFVRVARAKLQHIFHSPMVRLHCRNRRRCSVTDTSWRGLGSGEVGEMLEALAGSSLGRVSMKRAHGVPNFVSNWPIPTRWGDVRLQKLIQ